MNFKNKLDEDYINIVSDIIKTGTHSDDRTGTGTVKKFGYLLEHKMETGIPMLTSKKVFFKGVVAELLWFLSGETNIKPLIDQGVNIWNGDCYKRYKTHYEKLNKMSLFEEEPLMDENQFCEYIKTHNISDPFVLTFGDIGKAYSYQWVKLKGNNQIKTLINTLKNNPDSRRMIVDSWDPLNLNNMLLTPCHFAFQVFTRKISKENPQREISLMVHIRSSDTILGLPFNILSYGILLEMLAQQVDMIPGELKLTLGDAHVYSNQVELFEEQKVAETFALPKVKINKAKDIFSYKIEDFEIIGYESSKTIKYPLSN